MHSDLPIPVQPAAMPQPAGHYSHGTAANGFLFVSGQLPVTPAGEKLVHASFAEQARQVLANLAAVLEAGGSGIARLVQVRVYLDDIENWPEFNRIYAEWAGDARPSRAIVPTGKLHYGLKLEIEAVALQAA